MSPGPARAVAGTLVGLLERSRKVGEHLGARLDDIAARLGPDRVIEARGMGMLRALELREPAARIIDACRNEGVLVIQAGANVLRFAPPLIVTCEQIDAGLAPVERGLRG